MSGKRVRSVSIKWSRHKRDPGQLWRFWRDRGPDFTGYRIAWFYVVVEYENPTPWKRHVDFDCESDEAFDAEMARSADALRNRSGTTSDSPDNGVNTVDK